MARERAGTSRGRSAFVVTCEHAGNRVPGELTRVMAPARAMLRTHRGWDPGALEAAVDFARALGCWLYASDVSRLVIDLNRSLGAPDLLGPPLRGLPGPARERILARHYRPYRREVERRIATLAARGPVTHLSVHTFTPVRNGVRRDVDVGLLFDPGRPRERALCEAWKSVLELSAPDLRVRPNQPYAGTDDGFTTHLRTRFPDDRYAGIELELNQRFPRAGGPRWERVRATVAAAFVLAGSLV